MSSDRSGPPRPPPAMPHRCCRLRPTMRPRLTAAPTGRPPGGRRGRRLALAAAALAAALGALCGTTPAAAGPPPPAPPHSAAEVPAPSFEIESIRVEGVRPRSKAVVVSASLLEPGRAYGERELRDAVSRIVRLPFVLAADFALERGSERGRYGLVIRVVETRRFFFAADRRYTVFGRRVALENASGRRESLSSRGTAGYRHALGDFGEAFAAVDTEQGGQVGLTHYNLLGRHAIGSIAYSRTGPCCATVVFPLALDPTFGSWSLAETEQVAARLALPLGGNYSLRLAAEMLRTDDADRRNVLTSPVEDEVASAGVPSFEYRWIEAAWVYDDSDDPLLPRGGRTWALGIEAHDLDTRLGFFEPGTPPFEISTFPYRGELVRVVASGAVHHALTPRQAVTVSARIAAGRSRFPNDVDGTAGSLDSRELALAFTHRVTLWQPPEEFATLWLETEAGYAYEEISPGLLASLGQSRLGVWLVLRNAWGVVRAGFAWVDIEDGVREFRR